MLIPYQPGQKVDYVPRVASAPANVNAAVNKLGPALGAGLKSVFDKAREEGSGARKRGVVDLVIDATTVRVMLCDSCDLVFAHPDELQPLDAISSLADILTSKSLVEQLEEAEADERRTKLAPDEAP